MNHTWTVEQFKKYCLSKDSMGDILHYMNDENIDKANISWERGDLEDEDVDERMKTYNMEGTSPMGKKYTASGVYIHDELEEIQYIDEA